MPFGPDLCIVFSRVVEHYTHSVLYNPPDGSLCISPLKSVLLDVFLLTNNKDTHGSEEGVAACEADTQSLAVLWACSDLSSH